MRYSTDGGKTWQEAPSSWRAVPRYDDVVIPEGTQQELAHNLQEAFNKTMANALGLPYQPKPFVFKPSREVIDGEAKDTLRLLDSGKPTS